MIKFICNLLSALCLVSLISCGPASNTVSKNDTETIKMDTITTMSGLRYVEKEIGKGNKVDNGMNVKVDYAGYFIDGKLFDTSIKEIGLANNYDRGGYPFEPISFQVGKGQVIKGWDEGLTTNMFVGGKRRLIIPYQLAYGEAGRSPAIPPRSVLIFDISVLEAK